MAMASASWLAGAFAAVMIAIAVYCVLRLIASGRWRRPTELDADGVHVFMGAAMAGMFLAGLGSPPAGPRAAGLPLAAPSSGGPPSAPPPAPPPAPAPAPSPVPT